MLTDLPSELIPVNEIAPDPQQPRRSFELAQHEALKASLDQHGLLHPILVRRDAESSGYRIICGERRWRCAQELGWAVIAVRILPPGGDAAQLLTLQLIENLSRENLNPLDEARSLARLQELLGCARDGLAAETHRSPASICRSFKLLELPSEIQALVEVGRLPLSVAAELHACRDRGVQRELAENYAAGGLIRADVTAAVRHANAARKPAKPKSWSLTLATGMTLRLTSAVSLKDCERAAAQWLRQLRAAKATVPDLEAFIAMWNTKCGQSTTSAESPA